LSDLLYAWLAQNSLLAFPSPWHWMFLEQDYLLISELATPFGETDSLQETEAATNRHNTNSTIS